MEGWGQRVYGHQTQPKTRHSSVPNRVLLVPLLLRHLLRHPPRHRLLGSVRGVMGGTADSGRQPCQGVRAGAWGPACAAAVEGRAVFFSGLTGGDGWGGTESGRGRGCKGGVGGLVERRRAAGADARRTCEGRDGARWCGRRCRQGGRRSVQTLVVAVVLELVVVVVVVVLGLGRGCGCSMIGIG